MDPQPTIPSPSVEPVVPPSPKLPWIIGGLVLLVLVGIGGIFLGKQMAKPASTPVPLTVVPTIATAPTANWKVYEDPINGYSLKYPLEFQLSDYREGNYSGISLNFLGPNQGRQESELIDGIMVRTLFVSDSPNTKQLAEAGRERDAQPQPQTSYPKASDLKETTLNGKSAYTYTISDSVNSLEIQVFYVPLKSGSLRISRYISPRQNTAYMNTVDQILSTFKFTNAEVSDWKTYVNSTYNFQIKYPSVIPSISEQPWVYEEYPTSTTSFSIGFGTPQSKSGGYIWGVNVYENSDSEKLIAEMGSQFKDRKEQRQNITVAGFPAVLVTVTTNEVPNWVLKEVYIGRNSRTYVIANGAIDSAKFTNFYSSFSFLQ